LGQLPCYALHVPRRRPAILTAVVLAVALLLNGAALPAAATTSSHAERDSVTAPIPAESGLGLPAQRIPDVARPARDLQPALARDREGTSTVAFADSQRPPGAALLVPARRARSNPLRLRLHATDDPPH
jgi:hypothetical protein